MSHWYCRARGCRFKDKHTTLGHKCGIHGCLNPYGHGQGEHFCQKVDSCGIPTNQWNDVLKNEKNKRLPDQLQCQLQGCKYKWSHSNGSHQCKKCLRYGAHTTSNCLINSFDASLIEWSLPEEYLTRFFGLNNDGFIEFNVGMGCILYIKKQENEMSTMFLHSDSWGQYGEQTSDLPTRIYFINALNNITNEWNQFYESEANRLNLGGQVVVYPGDDETDDFIEKIKCPLCRSDVVKNNIKFIKGLDATCIVCFTNNIETYFPECEHSSVCRPCLQRL